MVPGVPGAEHGAREREALLVGVDGGASGVRAVAVEVVPAANPDRERAPRAPRPLGLPVELDHPRGGFRPLAVEDQERQQRAPAIGAEERAAGSAWVEGAAECVRLVAAAAGATRVRVGVCLPGVKTADGRGTRLVKNGPRVPDYLARLEARLVDLGLEPAGPLGPLESDGRCALLGEWLAEAGGLAGVKCGYYLGGGSGLAEGLLLAGAPVALDGEGDWFPRAWQLAAQDGTPIEDLVAPAVVNARWRAAAGLGPAERAGEHHEPYPEEHLDTDVLAVAALTNQGTQLARLVHARLVALEGRGHAPERVVIGQRLGQLLVDERAAPFVRRTAERELARLLYLDAPESLARRWLERRPERLFGTLAEGRFVASSLRIAPALGAAWCAHARVADGADGAGGAAGADGGAGA